MLTPKKSILQLLFYLILTIFFSLSSTHSTSITPTPASFCGKIKIQNLTTPLNSLLLCKSQNLYFRTSLGLFPVSSIDYEAQTLTISHPSCSPSLHFISPSLLSAGFPPPKPNSLLLFNCYNGREKPTSSFLQNCSHSYGCSAQEQDLKGPFSCLLVDDSEKLELGFHPKDLNCSHYRRVYRSSSSSSAIEGFEGGTRVSFGIPDHIPRICDECSKPDGNCGIGLRCMCHPKECKNRVISGGVSRDPFDNLMLTSLFTLMVVSLMY